MTTPIRNTASHNGCRRSILFRCSNLTLPAMAQATALMQELDAHSVHRLANCGPSSSLASPQAGKKVGVNDDLELVACRRSQVYPEAHNASIALHIPPLFSFNLNFQDIIVSGWCTIKSSGIRIRDDWWGKLRRKGKTLVVVGSSLYFAVFHPSDNQGILQPRSSNILPMGNLIISSYYVLFLIHYFSLGHCVMQLELWCNAMIYILFALVFSNSI